MATTPRSAKSIFLEAVEKHQSDKWEAFLDGACGGDAEMRLRVEDLLNAHRESDSLLDQSEATVDFPRGEAEPGAMIGRYKLLQQIGEGGFGVVFMAEQQQPVKRKVALKVIKPGMDTKAVVARFEAERQALAMMDHANIAKVFDGGATEQGRPYFVMELVKGVAITEYCDKNQLPTEERLQLFNSVCQAVQHAHQKGVIHRDLKPSNILVTLHDGQPVIKVIDFGVSKAINQQLTEKTLFTAFGQMVGTPQYMSPEQAEMSGLDVDTRSDIYSLGVILYELLTGTTPLETGQLRDAGYAEMQRLIREQEPPKPSTRLSSSGKELTIIAKHRSVSADRLQSMVQGDLDWIVMKALDKDRSRRYPTANGFADDIIRFLSDEPVEARPPSTSYRFRKYLRRNRGLVLGVTSVAAALLLGIVGLGTGLARSLAVQRRLELTTEELEQRNDQLQDSLKSWTDELVHRAIIAAVSGRKDIVEKIIKEAHATGVPPQWEQKVRGLLALHGGRLDEAITILEKAVEIDPDDAGAVATLMRVQLEAGNHGEFIRLKDRLKGLDPRTDEDALLVGHAMIYTDIDKGEEMIREVLARQPSPLALAAHSEALLKLYYKTGNRTYLDRAAPERSAAMLLLPDSVWLAVTDFFANFVSVLDGDDSADGKSKLDAAWRKLGNFGQHPIALHGRASYCDYTKQEVEARDHWTSVRGSGLGKWCLIYFAAFEYRNGRRDEAIDILEESPNELLSKSYLAEALALDPQRRNDALKIYGQLASGSKETSFGPDDVVVVPETILLLSGNPKRASDEARRRLRQGQIQGWDRTLLEFLANPNPEDLTEAAGDRSEIVEAEKLIACWYLSKGEIQQAIKHLRKCQEAFPIAPEAYWADAIATRLQDDKSKDWREWLVKSITSGDGSKPVED